MNHELVTTPTDVGKIILLYYYLRLKSPTGRSWREHQASNVAPQRMLTQPTASWLARCSPCKAGPSLSAYLCLQKIIAIQRSSRSTAYSGSDLWRRKYCWVDSWELGFLLIGILVAYMYQVPSLRLLGWVTGLLYYLYGVTLGGLVGLYCISCSIIRKECSPRTLESQSSILIGFSGNPELSLSIGSGIMLGDYVCLHS